jgi:rhamnosyltransferase
MLSGQSICFFSSFFLTKEIPFFVQYYLQQIRPHFSKIIFITNDEKELSEASQLWLEKHVDDWFLVKNEGFDFGMWQKGINREANIAEYDHIALMNDSCICFRSLDGYFDWYKESSADVTGMVMSYQVKKHLQSYFLVIKKSAVPIFVHYMKSTNFIDAGYKEVVQRGEIGLSEHLMRAGIKLDAQFEPTKFPEASPSFVHYQSLLKAGMPLIKRKLFKSPAGFMVANTVYNKVPSLPDAIKAEVSQIAGDALTDRLVQYEALIFSDYWQYCRRFLRYWIRKTLGLPRPLSIQ